MLEAGRGREKGREKEREARGFVRKGMMYDLSVPRSAVARFSTPSSSRKCAVASHSYELMVTLLVKMALMYPLSRPQISIPHRIRYTCEPILIESNRRQNRCDSSFAILRPQDDLVSLTDFRIESIPRSLNNMTRKREGK